MTAPIIPPTSYKFIKCEHVFPISKSVVDKVVGLQLSSLQNNLRSAVGSLNHVIYNAGKVPVCHLRTAAQIRSLVKALSVLQY